MDLKGNNALFDLTFHIWGHSSSQLISNEKYIFFPLTPGAHLGSSGLTCRVLKSGLNRCCTSLQDIVDNRQSTESYLCNSKVSFMPKPENQVSQVKSLL